MIWRSGIYEVDLGVPVGHEPARVRPGPVVSADVVDNGAVSLAGIVPITSRDYGLRSDVEIERGPSGLGHVPVARCDQVRMVSVRRLGGRRGSAPVDAMDLVDRALRFIFDH